jgi:hypothetical protein
MGHGALEVWEVWEDGEEIFPPSLPTPPHLPRAVSFPKMVKIARVKEIKIQSKRTIFVKNFGGFSPKSVVFLCAFAPLREIIFLTNLEK